MFSGLKKLMKFGLQEGTIKRWRNKGIIIPFINNNRNKWIGFEIKYVENLEYGRTCKAKRRKKRKLNL